MHRSYRYKYITYMMLVLGGTSAMFLVPAWYFIKQNYQLFTKIAYDTHPTLISHLERESVFLNTFLALSLIAILGLTFFLGAQMTGRILQPLLKLEQHMRQVMLGNWTVEDFPVQANEDFRDLAMTYDYLFRSLKATAEQELELLEKLAIDPANREAYAAWKTLMNIKREKLGMDEVGNITALDLEKKVDDRLAKIRHALRAS